MSDPPRLQVRLGPPRGEGTTPLTGDLVHSHRRVPPRIVGEEPGRGDRVWRTGDFRRLRSVLLLPSGLILHSDGKVYGGLGVSDTGITSTTPVVTSGYIRFPLYRLREGRRLFWVPKRRADEGTFSGWVTP